MKRIVTVLLLACLLLTLGGCGKKKKEDNNVLRIGVLEPRTGALSETGLREMLGIHYANSVMPTLQLKGRTYRVELDIADNESTPEKAASAAEKLVADGCAVVLGSYGDALSAAASEVFLKAGLPLIAASGNDPLLTAGNDHCFRVSALPERRAQAMARFAAETLGAKTVYCLACFGDEEGTEELRVFARAAEAVGLRTVTTAFPAQEPDFAAYLNSAAQEGADLLFAACGAQYAQSLLEKDAALESALPILAGARWDDPDVAAAAAGKAQRVYVASLYAEGVSPDFDEGFREWMNANSEALAYNGGSDAISEASALAYAAYQTALAAATAAGSADKADILAVLPSVSCSAVTGEIVFDDSGDATRCAVRFKRVNADSGAWELAATVKSEE